MTLNRRNFLRTTLSGAAVAAVSTGALASCAGKASSDEKCPETKSCCNSKAKLNLSFQEGTPPGENLNEKFDYMEKMGIVGF